MDIFETVRLIIVLIVFVGVIFAFLGSILAAYFVYNATLVKKNKNVWTRSISETGDDKLLDMWNQGLEWAKNNAEFKKEVAIKSFDNLNLVAEFYDFGFDKSVLILPGRRECLFYSYFYAFPYKNAGFNVLLIDHRAHGNSEGKYATAGILEAKDVISWCEFLTKKFNQKEIVLHGVCVGTCCSINVIRDTSCPANISKVILDSTFINYREIYANHMAELGHKIGITFNFIWKWFKHYTGVDISMSNPLQYIGALQMPVCFMWGKLDAYCLPEKSEMIWQKCTSKNKEIHWFENGTHSKLRLSEPERYDQIIVEFLKK